MNFGYFNKFIWILIQNTSLSVIFLIGRKDSMWDVKMEKESQEFNDILRADFIDDYYNLTLKSMFSLKFYLNYWQVIQKEMWDEA